MSVHRLIVGQSMSGKTNLAKSIAHGFDQTGAGGIVVFDPLASSGWPVDALKYSDPERFLADSPNWRSCAVFVDEARLLWECDARRADRILYQYRHHGLQVHVIAQRMRMVPPNARDQCATVYAFRQSSDDTKLLVEQYGDGLKPCNRLKKGEFLVSDGYSTHRFRLDYSDGPPPKIVSA